VDPQRKFIREGELWVVETKGKGPPKKGRRYGILFNDLLVYAKIMEEGSSLKKDGSSLKKDSSLKKSVSPLLSRKKTFSRTCILTLYNSTED
jgi:ABC-type uncharacterized transport system YnjBCD ATPase subunit